MDRASKTYTLSCLKLCVYVCVFEVCVNLPPSCSAELPLIFVLSLPFPCYFQHHPFVSFLFISSVIYSPHLLFFPPCLSLFITSFFISSFHLFPSHPSSSSQCSVAFIPSHVLWLHPFTFLPSHSIRSGWTLFYSCILFIYSKINKQRS